MPPADETPTALPGDLPPTASYDPNGTPSWVAAVIGGRQWRPGDAVGRYRLERHHARGGLGDVWQAHDPATDRTVAVKTLRPDRCTPELARRFVREAQLTGRLDHPAVVPVHDLIDGPDGPAYVMRFAGGDTLAQAAAGYHRERAAGAAEPLAFERLLDAFVRVCQAVAYAHSRGVLHRDLKGQNVICGRFGDVFLIDWGLGKAADAPDEPGDPTPLSPHPDDRETRTGQVLGTPAYMAPEVASGRRAVAASDVYGLGAMLYQLLTNRTPVPSDGTPQEVLGRVRDGVPIPPARQVNPAVPPTLEAICRKALAREVGDRYPSAQAVADDVRAYLAGEPVAAYPEPLSARLWRRARRHRAAALAGVVALAAVAVVSTAAAALVYQEKERTAARERDAVEAREDADRERQEAERQRDNYGAMLGTLRSYSDGLTDVVVEAETGTAAGRRTVADRKAALERAVGAAEKLLDASPDDTQLRARLARLLWYTGNLARVRNDRPTAERSLRAAATLHERLAAAAPAGDWVIRNQLARTLDDRAGLSEVFGQLTMAEELSEKAAVVLAGLPADHPAVRRAVALNRLQRAELDTRLGRRGPAEEAAGRAASLLAELADGPPGDRHFLDAALHGTALTARAVARREWAGPTDDLRPALEDHTAAVAALRTAAEADERPDVRHLYHLGVYEQAVTRHRAKHPPAALLDDVDRCIAAWRKLVARDRGVAMYRRSLGRGLVLWAALRVDAAPLEPAAREAAATALAEAARLANQLRAEGPDRPGYQADTIQVYAGLGRLQIQAAHSDATRREAKSRYRQAYTCAKEAVSLSPGDKLIERQKVDLVQECAKFGFDVTAKLTPGR